MSVVLKMKICQFRKFPLFVILFCLLFIDIKIMADEFVFTDLGYAVKRTTNLPFDPYDIPIDVKPYLYGETLNDYQTLNLVGETDTIQDGLPHDVPEALQLWDETIKSNGLVVNGTVIDFPESTDGRGCQQTKDLVVLSGTQTKYYGTLKYISGSAVDSPNIVWVFGICPVTSSSNITIASGSLLSTQIGMFGISNGGNLVTNHDIAAVDLNLAFSVGDLVGFQLKNNVLSFFRGGDLIHRLSIPDGTYRWTLIDPNSQTSSMSMRIIDNSTAYTNDHIAGTNMNIADRKVNLNDAIDITSLSLQDLTVGGLVVSDVTTGTLSQSTITSTNLDVNLADPSNITVNHALTSGDGTITFTALNDIRAPAVTTNATGVENNALDILDLDSDLLRIQRHVPDMSSATAGVSVVSGTTRRITSTEDLTSVFTMDNPQESRVDMVEYSFKIHSGSGFRIGFCPPTTDLSSDIITTLNTVFRSTSSIYVNGSTVLTVGLGSVLTLQLTSLGFVFFYIDGIFDYHTQYALTGPQRCVIWSKSGVGQTYDISLVDYKLPQRSKKCIDINATDFSITKTTGWPFHKMEITSLTKYFIEERIPETRIRDYFFDVDARGGTGTKGAGFFPDDGRDVSTFSNTLVANQMNYRQDHLYEFGELANYVVNNIQVYQSVVFKLLVSGLVHIYTNGTFLVSTVVPLTGPLRFGVLGGGTVVEPAFTKIQQSESLYEKRLKLVVQSSDASLTITDSVTGFDVSAPGIATNAAEVATKLTTDSFDPNTLTGSNCSLSNNNELLTITPEIVAGGVLLKRIFSVAKKETQEITFHFEKLSGHFALGLVPDGTLTTTILDNISNSVFLAASSAKVYIDGVQADDLPSTMSAYTVPTVTFRLHHSQTIAKDPIKTLEIVFGEQVVFTKTLAFALDYRIMACYYDVPSIPTSNTTLLTIVTRPTVAADLGLIGINETKIATNTTNIATNTTNIATNTTNVATNTTSTQNNTSELTANVIGMKLNPVCFDSATLAGTGATLTNYNRTINMDTTVSDKGCMLREVIPTTLNKDYLVHFAMDDIVNSSAVGLLLETEANFPPNSLITASKSIWWHNDGIYTSDLNAVAVKVYDSTSNSTFAKCNLQSGSRGTIKFAKDRTISFFVDDTLFYIDSTLLPTGILKWAVISNGVIASSVTVMGNPTPCVPSYAYYSSTSEGSVFNSSTLTDASTFFNFPFRTDVAKTQDFDTLAGHIQYLGLTNKQFFVECHIKFRRTTAGDVTIELQQRIGETAGFATHDTSTHTSYIILSRWMNMNTLDRLYFNVNTGGVDTYFSKVLIKINEIKTGPHTSVP